MWFREQEAPRLHRGAPSAEISFDDFAELFLHRHAASVSERTVQTLRSGSHRLATSSATGPLPSDGGPNAIEIEALQLPESGAWVV
jgi:hypothetical protein